MLLAQGGLGSAIALGQGSFKAGPNGTFIGRIIAQPDRGYNVFVIYILLATAYEGPGKLTLCTVLSTFFREGTIDWQARHHSFDFVLSPYYGKGNLDFDTAAKTLSLQYKSTLLYTKG
jgi:hypothetical protein